MNFTHGILKALWVLPFPFLWNGIEAFSLCSPRVQRQNLQYRVTFLAEFRPSDLQIRVEEFVLRAVSVLQKGFDIFQPFALERETGKIVVSQKMDGPVARHHFQNVAKDLFVYFRL
jgi:hypothetical protein